MNYFDEIIRWAPIILPIIINVLMIIGLVIRTIRSAWDILLWLTLIFFTLFLVDALFLMLCLPWLARTLNQMISSPSQMRLWLAGVSAGLGSIYPLFWGMYLFPVLRQIVPNASSTKGDAA